MSHLLCQTLAPISYTSQPSNLPISKNTTLSLTSLSLSPCSLFSSLLSSAMPLKVTHSLITIILCLSILCFFLHGWPSFTFKHMIHQNNIHPSLSHHRRALAGKFNITPFLHHRHRRTHLLATTKSEIDPLYGAEKRLVPTGPNPLHH
ncbi:CLAVATA3/ESR (CLE)-related protein 12-like [Actinidia eriantha]|uniref:CLAVATA3/ESR (CLE)-related protein 12-like n=1 Tax=Actinidia eriantha TaxID=165200 RepID=UPI0025846FDF|nr:CLAVATA3/ESR (CLE)-related protein 12-like [Actinidia eriantha]